jgi:pimeloyl-ACP methyl ester carboxylesterase
MLEVIDKGQCTSEHPVPLLFVHGAWHAAWCWDEHFLDFFAEMGYRAMALSLRGHGTSPTARPLRSCSIADYVDDVASVADDLPTPPVVIGHSMGGLVVQKYLESHSAPAAVLLASVPSSGGLGTMLRMTWRHPASTTRALLTGNSLRGVAKTPEQCRESFFTASTPESKVVDCHTRLQQESARVIRVDFALLSRPRPKRVSSPVMVVGASDDGVFTTKEQRATAHAYRTEAEIVPDMGHDMMLEPGWSDVAERMNGWLRNRGL